MSYILVFFGGGLGATLRHLVNVFCARYQRPTPYLWSEAEVLDLMAAARRMRPLLCALTYEALFGLLWCSGMRIGEAIGLVTSAMSMIRTVMGLPHHRGWRRQA